MREVYSLIPSYVSDELWKDATLLRLLSSVIADVSQTLRARGTALVVVEPNAAALQRVSVSDGLALMQSYCLLSDCVICFEGLQDRYPSQLIAFMCQSARELGLPILEAKCAPSGFGQVNSLAESLATLPQKGLSERRSALSRVLSRAPSITSTRLIDIDPNLELLIHRDRSDLDFLVPANVNMNQGRGAQVRFAKLPGSFALEVTSVCCGQTSAEEVLVIKKQLDEYKLLVFRNQNLSPLDQVRFTAFFGKPDMAWDNRNRAQGEPRIQIISNQYKGGQYHYDRSRRMSTVRYWHADTSFLANPTRYTFLYIQKVPDKYGLTYFANTKLGYESLPQSLKEAVNDKLVCHSFNYIFGELLRIRNEERADPVPDVLHPLVRRSKTGDALYLSELSQSHIVGLSKEESDKLITQVTEHCTQAQFCHTHVWRPGDFLVWDNFGVMHRGGFADPEYERVLYRTTVTVQDALPIGTMVDPDVP